jgi:hypothetical protein
MATHLIAVTGDLSTSDAARIGAALAELMYHDPAVITVHQLDRAALAQAINNVAYVYGDQPHPDGPEAENIEAVTSRLVDAVVAYLEGS